MCPPHLRSPVRSLPTWWPWRVRWVGSTIHSRRQLIARAHCLTFLRQTLNRRIGSTVRTRRSQRRLRRVRRARARYLRRGTGEARCRPRGRASCRVGDVGSGRSECLRRARFPQRQDQLGRGRHRSDAAERHQRTGARASSRAELRSRQALRPGGPRRRALGRAHRLGAILLFDDPGEPSYCPSSAGSVSGTPASRGRCVRCTTEPLPSPASFRRRPVTAPASPCSSSSCSSSSCSSSSCSSSSCSSSSCSSSS